MFIITYLYTIMTSALIHVDCYLSWALYVCCWLKTLFKQLLNNSEWLFLITVTAYHEYTDFIPGLFSIKYIYTHDSIHRSIDTR